MSAAVAPAPIVARAKGPTANQLKKNKETAQNDKKIAAAPRRRVPAGNEPDSPAAESPKVVRSRKETDRAQSEISLAAFRKKFVDGFAVDFDPQKREDVAKAKEEFERKFLRLDPDNAELTTEAKQELRKKNSHSASGIVQRIKSAPRRCLLVITPAEGRRAIDANVDDDVRASAEAQHLMRLLLDGLLRHMVTDADASFRASNIYPTIQGVPEDQRTERTAASLANGRTFEEKKHLRRQLEVRDFASGIRQIIAFFNLKGVTFNDPTLDKALGLVNEHAAFDKAEQERREQSDKKREAREITPAPEAEEEDDEDGDHVPEAQEQEESDEEEQEEVAAAAPPKAKKAKTVPEAKKTAKKTAAKPTK